MNVVDTVGAGDAFTAVLAIGLLKSLPLKTIHRQATDLSAYVCTQNGATPVLPETMIMELGNPKDRKGESMKNFNYFQPTETIYGSGRVNELGDIAKRFGEKCLLVTTPTIPALEPMYERVKKILTDAGLKVAHFDQVQPNPTTDNMTAGAEMAVSHGAELIIGLGGGSSMDAAKAIAALELVTNIADPVGLTD